MPARSVAQRRFFGMVAAGRIPKPKGMSMADVREFARTPERGLPRRVRPQKATPGRAKAMARRAVRGR